MFFKKIVLKYFVIFTGKHLCWSLLLIKLHAWRPPTLLKRDSNTGSFLWILRNFYEQLFLQNTSDGCFISSKFYSDYSLFRRYHPSKNNKCWFEKKMKQPSVQNYLHQYLRLKKMYSSSWEILSSRNSQFPKTY